MLLYLIMQVTLSLAQTQYEQQIKIADSLYKAKDYLKAGLTYSKAFNLNKKNISPTIRYSAASAWAMANRPDSAFHNLDLIAGVTYFGYDQLINNKDFAVIHEDKRWQPLLSKIKNTKLRTIPADSLKRDFDLLISSLKEAHTGLYWYNSYAQFDSLCSSQRAQIKPGMTDLDFYNIIAPLNAFIKEGHSSLQLGAQAQTYLKFSGKYFPVYLKFLDTRAYIINDVGALKTRGLILTKVNGHTIDDLRKKFMSYEPDDGYITTGKNRWIESNGQFSSYYARCYPPAPFFDIETIDPATGEKKIFNHIPSTDYDNFIKSYRAVVGKIPGATYARPAELKIDTVSATATLSINTFSANRYKAAGMKFREFIDSAFTCIKNQHVKHLIIDVRKNGGGREGYEDYLLAYMIDKDYLKYKYVQASALSYSFYQHTDYKEDYKSLESELKDEHYLEKDGRVLRKPGIEAHEKPKSNPFKGDIYVLIGGLTYSGGSEFASLARNHTDAIFIGEETGGGYYGNTSGIRITLKLPNSKIEIGIPILKFAVDTPKDNVPFGRGTLPDYKVEPTISQFLVGYDAEMEMAKKLIMK